MNKNISISDELNNRLKAVADRTGLKQQAIMIRGIKIAVEILEKENGFMTTEIMNPSKQKIK